MLLSFVAAGCGGGTSDPDGGGGVMDGATGTDAGGGGTDAGGTDAGGTDAAAGSDGGPGPDAGDVDAGRATIETALARVQPGREVYMRPELLMLRAGAATDGAQAEADLRAALAEAEDQGALTVALRAAAQLALRQAGSRRCSTAMGRRMGAVPMPFCANQPRRWQKSFCMSTTTSAEAAM